MKKIKLFALGLYELINVKRSIAFNVCVKSRDNLKRSELFYHQLK